MYKISKEFNFSASHRLTKVEPGHPCSKSHGHNYKVLVELQAGELNQQEFVVDYRKLAPVKRFIDEFFDHQDLNEVFPLEPTAENIARYLFSVFKQDFPSLSAVEVSETDKTRARYEKA